MRNSPIREITARCVEAGAINLAQGLCRVDPPVPLIEAMARADRLEHTYSDARGIPDLRLAIAEKLARDNGIEADPDTQVLVTVGTSSAFYATLRAHLRSGDEVVLIEPFYSYHRAAIELCGMTPRVAPLCGPGLRLTEDTLAGAVSARTRAIVVCTPANPSGRRFDRAEIAAVAALARRHDLLVITDEIYEYIHFTDAAHLSPATVEDLADRTVTISGLSKTFSVPGWRLGYLTGPPRLVDPVRAVSDVISICAPVPLQRLACTALGLPTGYYADLRQMYARKKEIIASAFRETGCTVPEPEGSYYLFIGCLPLGVDTGAEAAELLLTEAGVGAVPGEAFHLGPPSAPLIRICFSAPDAELLDAAARIRKLRPGTIKKGVA
ncbi:pyridoxal phosphate-dependent aminotransferase [Nonomuraea aurantiaca]|uniref:pyridoxal phosphate-dependent aminotransferase n=1 Tax=Nonomuraea aurantiaca TaxID=2878562 RepID=UPI001CDA26AB|nr:pyridoxal phosphate-dependent aminotransferase [Nonomuraea aurantiaca]MCA2220022.1 pyridoxal phosphate-dependent aminotransferase [Nonomuraea aurantiaca]